MSCTSFFRRSRIAVVHCSSICGGTMSAPAPLVRRCEREAGSHHPPTAVLATAAAAAAIALSLQGRWGALMTIGCRSCTSRSSGVSVGDAVRDSPPVVGRIIGVACYRTRCETGAPLLLEGTIDASALGV